MTDLNAMPVVHLSDTYSPHGVSVMSAVMTATNVGSQTVLMLFLYAVTRHSPKMMGSLRYLMVAFVTTSYCAELMFMMAKPTVLTPGLVVYPQGWLAPMSQRTMAVIFFGQIVAAVTLCDLLVMMLFQRYLAVAYLEDRHNPWMPRIFYIALWGSNAVLTGVCCFFFAKSILPETQVLALVREHILDSEELLKFQPSLLAFDTSRLHTVLSAMGVGAVYALTRTVLIGGLVALNWTLLRRRRLTYSPSTYRAHALFFRAILVQLCGIIVLALVPTVLVLLSAFWPHVLSVHVAWLIAIPCVHSFILYDIGASICCLKPYRLFFLHMLSCHAAQLALTSSSAVRDDSHAHVVLPSHRHGSPSGVYGDWNRRGQRS